MPIEDTFTGASNPYALAELIAGRRINWKKVADIPRLLEAIYHMSYKDIMYSDSSPIFAAANLKRRGEIYKRDLAQEAHPEDDFSRAKKYADVKNLENLRECLKVKDIAGLRVERIDFLSNGSLLVEIRPSATQKLNIEKISLSKEVLELIVPMQTLEEASSSDAYFPSFAQWKDIGNFFNEAAEYSDPIQGSLGDCYLIAALSSVAWATPRLICHRTRATGEPQYHYSNVIDFYDEDGKSVQVEVRDRILIGNTTNAPVYASSREAGEIWPAIYEKAYAKWKTGTHSDCPDFTQIAGGSAYVAMQELTGMKEWHMSTSTLDIDQIWEKVMENSQYGKTFNPMAAGTTSEYLIQQQGLTYQGTGIYGGHAYSILGYAQNNGTKYIVLRNPWGRGEAVVGNLSGTIQMLDTSWWRHIDLMDVDGVFAVDVSTFKTYFNYLGGVSP